MHASKLYASSKVVYFSDVIYFLITVLMVLFCNDGFDILCKKLHTSASQGFVVPV